MDGLSVAVNIIALVSALKDLYDLCKEIRRSFLKIRENQHAITRLKNKLADSIKDVSKILKRYRVEFDKTEFLGTLQDLKDGLKDLLKQCNRLWKENTRVISSSILRAWWSADEVERKIQLLEDRSKACYEGMNTQLTIQTAYNTNIIIRRLENIETAVSKSSASSTQNVVAKSDKVTTGWKMAKECVAEDKYLSDANPRILRHAVSNLEVTSSSQSSTSTARRASFTGLPEHSKSTTDTRQFHSSTDIQTNYNYLTVPPVRHGFYMSNSSSAVSSSTSLQSEHSYESSATSSSALSGALPTYDEYLSNESYQSYLHYVENGLVQEAFDALEKTIVIHRSLAKLSSKSLTLELSEYLQQSSRLLFSLGRKEEAAERSQNAVEILQQLVIDGKYLDHELAVALISLSGRLHSLQRYDVAADHARKALEILTKLDSGADQLHDPDIPRANLRLALIYMDKREDKKAYSYLVHAVNGMRRIAHSGSAGNDCAKEFTSYLHSHFRCCSRLGYQQEASKTIKELVETCRFMIETSLSSPYNEDISVVLQDLEEDASFHYSNGSYNVALIIYEALVKIWRNVVLKNANHHREDLAVSLRRLSCCLSKLNQNDSALKTIKEAITIHETLVSEDVESPYVMQLARDVSVQADILGNTRQFQRALPSARRAVDLYRRSFEQTPDGKEYFLSSLKLLAQCLRALGMNDELSNIDSEIATIVFYESFSSALA